MKIELLSITRLELTKSVSLLASLAVPFVFWLPAGCTSKSDAAGDAAGGSSGGSGGQAGAGAAVSTGGQAAGSSGNGGGGGTTSSGRGWTAMALLDDTTRPSSKVFRSGNDLVSGIYFASLDDGWVTTRGHNQTFDNGGAIYKATSKTLTSILFSANQDLPCLLGRADFMGIDKSPDGYVALASACHVVASHDGGKTFGVEANAATRFGIEQALTIRSFSAGTVMFADSGYIATTTGPPGPTSSWTTIWAPQAVPPTPNPVPTDECHVRQHNANPAERTVVYVSPDASLVAYVAATDAQEPIVCVSKDSGKSFLPRSLPNLPADAVDFAPSGVVFASATVGITFWGNSVYPDSAYIYRTADSGDTWARVPLPAAVASRSIELYSAFFAPDGTHGWIVGYDYGASAALMLRTTDNGVTWSASGGDLAAKTASAGVAKIYTGFALDALHIWVGGDYGILMANEAGGE